MKPRQWLLSYDISDPKRWRRVVKLAENAGDRIQKSLFWCVLSREELDTLHAGFNAVVQSPDRLFLRPVCLECRKAERWQGMGGHPERQQPFWVV